jgi:hypothetical protein
LITSKISDLGVGAVVGAGLKPAPTGYGNEIIMNISFETPTAEVTIGKPNIAISMAA